MKILGRLFNAKREPPKPAPAKAPANSNQFTPCIDLVWEFRVPAGLKELNNEQATIALLQDIRRELKKLNSTLATTEFLAVHMSEKEKE